MTILVQCRNGEMLRFQSIDNAEKYLESPDVEDGEYPRAFDEKGNVFSIEILSPVPKKKFLGIVIIKLSPVVIKKTEKNADTELANLLRKHLGVKPTEEISLEEMISRVQLIR